MNNRFIANPTSVKLQRSVFGRKGIHNSLTMSFGDLIPIRCEQVMPGENWITSADAVVEMPALKVPVRDNAYIDTFAFFVPYRLIWDDFEKFLGVADPSSWDEDEPNMLTPTFKVYNGSKAHLENTLLDYLHDPIPDEGYVDGEELGLDDLRYRAYFLIWNEWFRDQNIDDPILINKTSGSSRYNSNHDSSDEPGMLTLMPRKVCRFKSLFSTLLPNPQRGKAVEISIGTEAPVVAGDPANIVTNGHSLKMVTPTGGNITNHGPLYGELDGKLNALSTTAGGSGQEVVPGNLVADLTKAKGITVNDFARLVATQKFLQLAATGGNRFREIILTQWGTVTDESRVDVPEYLGGSRQLLGMQQVLQTSGTGTTPQGNPAGHSITGITGSCNTRYVSQEPGLIMWLACARTDQTYSQGYDYRFIQHKRYDFGYYPVFANLGEEAIYKGETYFNDKNGVKPGTGDDKVLGYAPRYERYRTFNNQLAGKMRPAANDSLAVYNYGTKLIAYPSLNGEFLHETRANVDRTLAIESSETVPQLYVDYSFDFKVVRILPTYAEPDIVPYF